MTASTAAASNDIIVALESNLAKPGQSIPHFKTALANHREQQRERFHAGVDSEELTRENARFMDGIMRLAWSRFSWNENRTRWRKTRISLLAVGGYGRAELHPYSDIDLLLLLERSNYEKHASNIQSFLTLLWDIGLEVGHSVRSVKECSAQASMDVTVLTAMMEARTLCGDDELFQKMSKRIAADKMWGPVDFFKAKREEQRDRHKRSNHTEYSLEPNVKTSPGGLRDIQTVLWIARREFNTDRYDDLVAQQFLTSAESASLKEGRKLLVKIRYALHLLNDRDEDRLLFEHQRQLAADFGYVDGDQLAVEKFMQDYYRTAQRLNFLNELLLQHFEEEIVKTRTGQQVTSINERFQTRGNYLEVTSESVFRDFPPALLEMFVVVGHSDTIDGIRAATIRLARDHVYLIDEDFRNSPDANRLFIELLGVSNHLFSQLRRMNRFGILGAYLPEFERVIGQMQFDLFHIYTVDAHTLQVVRNMRRFRYKNQEQQFPIAAHIHARLPKVELLYIAGLYHDIAKGQGGDHSELGVNVAAAFCKRHGLGTWDTNLVCWLVRHHLVMSTTAQRKDIQDPEVIYEFAQFVGDQVRLDYLYALTVADINATNPTLWNSFRASLMSQLYLETKRMLRQGLETAVDRDHYVDETRSHALARLAEHDITEEEAGAIWEEVDEDYFVRESVADIVWHTQAIAMHQNQDEPLIIIRDDITRRRSDEGSTQIFIHMDYSRSIFYSIVTALDNLTLNIVDARIPSSSSGKTFYTFVVLESNGLPVGERPGRIDRIQNTLRRYLSEGIDGPASNRRTSRALKQFPFKTEVRISLDPSGLHTILEVVAPDRPGLLSIIARIFVELDIYLLTARITTLGERVEDVFHIISDSGLPITDEADQQRLRQHIKEALDSHVEQIAV